MYTGSCRLTFDWEIVNKIVTAAAGAGLPTLGKESPRPPASRKTQHGKRYKLLIDVLPMAAV
jgi:hypothetical protein